MELEITPAIDFESIVFKKGQRAPNRWKVVRLIADDFPAGWPPGKPYLSPSASEITSRGIARQVSLVFPAKLIPTPSSLLRPFGNDWCPCRPRNISASHLYGSTPKERPTHG